MVLKGSRARLKTADEIETIELYTQRVKDKMRAFRKSRNLNKNDINKLMTLAKSSGWNTLESRKGVGFTLSTLIRISTVMEITLEELLSE